MTRRRLVLAVVGLTAGWWLFADSAARLLGLAPWDSSRPSQVIRFAHYGSYQDYETWRQVISAFEQAYPDLKVKQEFVPGFGNEYDNKLRRQLLAGVAADVLMIQDESFPRYAGSALANLARDSVPRDGVPSLIDDATLASLHADLHPTALASFSHAQALHALPLYGGSLLIYLNLECMERAAKLGRSVSVPKDDWSIADFRELCRQLTCDLDGDGQVDQYGLWHPWWGYYLPFLWSMGGEVLDESRSKWALSGPAALDAVQLYRDLLLKDRVCPQPGEFGQMRQDIAFLSGRVAMVINGPWFIPFLEESGLRDSYYIAHIPRGAAGRYTRVTWDGLGINAHVSGTRTTSALQFVLFSVRQHAQDLFASSRRFLPSRMESTAAFSGSASPNGAHRFVTSMDYLRIQPITRHWKTMDRAIKRQLRDMLNGRSTPCEFLSALSEDRDIVAHFEIP